jgi:hypothetical protein
LSRLVVALSLGAVRRVPLEAGEARRLHEAHPGTRGKLGLCVGGAMTTGWRVVPGALLVLALSWLRGLGLGAALALSALGCGGEPFQAQAPCPLQEVLGAACDCNGEGFSPAAGRRVICDGESLRDKELAAPYGALPGESCNGLDDDADGQIDEEGVCAAACSPEALARLGAGLRLPAPGDITVPDGSGEVPELLDVGAVPAFCLSATPPSTADDVTVACGEVLEVGAEGLSAHSLRIAPGGVVRVTAPAALAIAGEVLICPSATLQAGGAPSLKGNGQDGVDMDLVAGTLLHLGTIASRGGATAAVLSTARVGRSGAVRLESDRLLLAGALDTAGVDHPDGYGEDLAGGAGGSLWAKVHTESFLSGTIRTTGGGGGHQLGCGDGGGGGQNGAVELDVPVCCHGLSIGGSSGNGGAGGVLEDQVGGMDAPLAPGDYDLSLCTPEDRFRVEGEAGQRVTVSFLPRPGVDIDVRLLSEDGSPVARSEGLGDTEAVALPASGGFTLVVLAAGPVQTPGAYQLSFH